MYDPLLYSRNIGTITKKEQQELWDSKVCIVGLGGTGGYALEVLVRMGISEFIAFDNDIIDYSNFNRQILATVQSLGNKKPYSALNRALSMNPKIRFKPALERFTEFSLEKVKGCDIIVDCSDNMETRLVIESLSNKLKMPFVLSSAGCSGGMVTVFPKNSKESVEKMFQVKMKDLEKYSASPSVISPAPAFAGTLAASQAISHLLGKDTVEAPDVLFFDLFSKEILWKKRMK